MNNIRKIKPVDLPYIYKICFDTGFRGRDASPYYNNQFLLGQYYAAPYCLYSTENCFIIEDDDFQPSGYILGTTNSYEFNLQRAEFLLPLKKICSQNQNCSESCNNRDICPHCENNSIQSGICPHSESAYQDKSPYETDLKKMILQEITSFEQKNFKVFDSPIFEEYPAHLHIDLLPQLQGHHWGHTLMQTFLDNLYTEKCKGVHLGVDKENEKAVRFYKREGFEVLSEKEWGFLMGMKLFQ